VVPVVPLVPLVPVAGVVPGGFPVVPVVAELVDRDAPVEPVVPEVWLVPIELPVPVVAVLWSYVPWFERIRFSTFFTPETSSAMSSASRLA
jgi:hypothetical protein